MARRKRPGSTQRIDESELQDELNGPKVTADQDWLEGTMRIREDDVHGRNPSRQSKSDQGWDAGYRRGEADALKGHWARGQDPRAQRDLGRRGQQYRPLVLDRRDAVQVLRWYVSPGQLVEEGAPVVDFSVVGGSGTWIADRKLVLAACHVDAGQSVAANEPVASIRDIDEEQPLNDDTPRDEPVEYKEIDLNTPAASLDGQRAVKRAQQRGSAPGVRVSKQLAPTNQPDAAAQPNRQQGAVEQPAQSAPTPQRSRAPSVIGQDAATAHVGDRGVVSELKSLYRKTVRRPVTVTVNLMDPDGTRTTVEARQEPLVLGRHTDCDVVLNSPAASRQHARLFVDDDGRAVVEDLDSRNGILVNGARTRRAVIAPGIAVNVANYTLFVE